MLRIILLSALMCLGSCTYWQMMRTTQEVVEHYPSDNFIEEKIEEKLEDHFDLPEGSIDITPFSPED